MRAWRCSPNIAVVHIRTMGSCACAGEGACKDSLQVQPFWVPARVRVKGNLLISADCSIMGSCVVGRCERGAGLAGLAAAVGRCARMMQAGGARH